MDIARLRGETQLEHEAVEGSLPLMRADLTRDTYVKTLLRLHGLVAAWEDLVSARLSGSLKRLAQDRQRLALLDRDLAFFGVTTHHSEQPQLPAFPTIAELLGAMYVMEGSRLGGQLIAKHVEETLSLPSSVGSAFFRGYGKATREHWTEFLNVLSKHVDDAHTEEAILGAKKMFRAFGQWMRNESPSAYPNPDLASALS